LSRTDAPPSPADPSLVPPAADRSRSGSRALPLDPARFDEPPAARPEAPLRPAGLAVRPGVRPRPGESPDRPAVAARPGHSPSGWPRRERLPRRAAGSTLEERRGEALADSRPAAARRGRPLAGG